ncbi:MAG: flagellar assembly protein FliW [Sulfurospirillum sp.]|nr:flagellar assembly protein FliW [Sulfurospirillum sp.]
MFSKYFGILKSYVLNKKVELEKIDDFFLKLKSCDDDTVFMLINPFLLRTYDFKIPKYFENILELEESKSKLILNIMIIATPIESSVVNFIAPLIFNTDKHYVAQVLLDSNTYKEYGIMENISNYLDG